MTSPDMRRQIVLAVKGLGAATARPRPQSRVFRTVVPHRVLAAFETDSAIPACERPVSGRCVAGTCGHGWRLLPFDADGGWSGGGGRESSRQRRNGSD
jgi:hypothetical protein